MAVLPEPLATQLEKMIQTGQQNFWVLWLKDMNGLRSAQGCFLAYYKISAAWCGLGLMLWMVLRFRLLSRRILTPLIGVLLLGDLFWFSHDRNYQCNPALYYPEIPALRDVARAAPGRIIGYTCFPADFAEAVGLYDVRGYDGVDPARWVSLVTIAADKSSPMPVGGVLQWLAPRGEIVENNTARLSPVLDLLGVRYVIFRGSPPQNVKPAFQSPDYWVLENRSALPRVFIPHRVEVVPDENERLKKLALPEFNPREAAYVETHVDLPPECRGVVKITSEIPTRIVITAQMETAGLLVLADRWDKGWRAWLNRKPASILKTDQALRGVLLPAGSATVEFRYASATVSCGFLLAAGALAILLGWLAVALCLSRTRSKPTMTIEQPTEPENDIVRPS